MQNPLIEARARGAVDTSSPNFVPSPACNILVSFGLPNFPHL